MNYKINTVFFSATGTTKKIVKTIAERINFNIKSKEIIKNFDFTLPKQREMKMSFTKNDIVIIGVPVYAGRVPNVLVKYINTIEAKGSIAVAIVMYGNRNYDDALIELTDSIASNGFNVIAGSAFIGEHSFSTTLAKNRPDFKDLGIANDFADEISKIILSERNLQTVKVKGCRPYRKHYMPRNKDGIAVDIRKVTPKTSKECIDCKKCVEACPMGSIDYEDVTKLNGICIKCGACIKKCPVNAKYYDDENYLRHKKELEQEFVLRNEPELFYTY